MGLRSRAVLVALAAAATLGASVSSASARRLEVDNQGIRFVWEGSNKLKLRSEPFEIRCPVILEGSFHSKTISKVCGQLIGYITNAVAHACEPTKGIAWALNGVEKFTPSEPPFASTLPWHVRYASFTGSLPNITGVRLALIRGGFLIFQLEVEERCLYEGTAANPWFLTMNVGAAGLVTGVRSEPTPRILEKQGLLCASEIELEGTGSVFQLNSGNSITVRLVT